MATKLAFSEDLTTSHNRPMARTVWHAADPTARPREGTAKCGTPVTVPDEDYAYRESMNRMHWCQMCRSRP